MYLSGTARSPRLVWGVWGRLSSGVCFSLVAPAPRSGPLFCLGAGTHPGDTHPGRDAWVVPSNIEEPPNEAAKECDPARREYQADGQRARRLVLGGVSPYRHSRRRPRQMGT